MKSKNEKGKVRWTEKAKEMEEKEKLRKNWDIICSVENLDREKERVIKRQKKT